MKFFCWYLSLFDIHARDYTYLWFSRFASMVFSYFHRSRSMATVDFLRDWLCAFVFTYFSLVRSIWVCCIFYHLIILVIGFLLSILLNLFRRCCFILLFIKLPNPWAIFKLNMALKNAVWAIHLWLAFSVWWLIFHLIF